MANDVQALNAPKAGDMAQSARAQGKTKAQP
jgi:hypothetical protein